MDRHSYFMAVAVAYLSLALLLTVAERPKRGTPSWMLALAYLSIGVGAYLQALDDRIPYAVATIFGNILAWLGLIYQAWAIRAMADLRVSVKERIIAGLALIAVIAILLALPSTLRQGGGNVVYAGLFAYTGLSLMRWRQATLALRALTAALFGAAAVLYLVRGFEFATGTVTATNPDAPAIVQPWVSNVLMPLSFMALISSAFGLLLLTRQMTERRLEEATRELERMAVRDELTGMPNRRYLLERVRTEIVRVARSGRPFSLAIIDLDGLKQINDSHGHAAGDAALRSVAEACVAALREQDVAARLGGDEFAVLLPDSDLGQAQAALARFLSELQGRPGPDQGSAQRLTASAGVAQYEPSETLDALFVRADEAMYLAKRNGGGSVASRAWSASMGDRSGTSQWPDS